jgi:hypothetical protein
MKNAPAFPLEMVYTQENEKFNGMTLRDYFAAKAMQALIQFEDKSLPFLINDSFFFFSAFTVPI